MSEVSCRAFSYFKVTEAAGLIDVAKILEGLDVTRAELENPSNRVPWDVWSVICDRAGAQLGNDPRLIASSGELVAQTDEDGFAGYVRSLGSMFVTPSQLVELLAEWGGPSLYRSMIFSTEALGGDRFRITVRLRSGYRPSKAYFHMVTGGLRALPAMFGWPPAVVEEVRVEPMVGTYVATFFRPIGLSAKLKIAWSALRAPAAVARELGFQHRQLVEALEAVRRQEGGFREALDVLPALVVLHREGRVVYANPPAERALERPSGTFVGAPLASLVGAEPYERLASLRPGGEPASLRIQLERGEFRHFDFLALPSFEFAGVMTSGLVALDVSERRRVEETNRVLLASLPDFVVRIGSEGRILDVHPGANPSETTTFLAGLKCFSLRDPPLVLAPSLLGAFARCRLGFERARMTGQEERFEITRGGLTFELRAVPVSSETEVLLLARDVTEQRRQEREQAVTERMVALGTLAAGVAHELRNPLTYVKLAQEQLSKGLEALREGAAVDAGALLELADEVAEGTKRVLGIVSSLATFSRVDVRPSLVLVDPCAALDKALAMASNDLRRRARVERRFAPDVPRVLADEARLVQVLVNLLVNAAQSFDAPIDTNLVTVCCTAGPADTVLITVTDTGRGIAPELLPRIFDPFFTTKPPGEGTGLGLSISHRIVREIGGEISVESATPSGTTFVLTLPRAPLALETDATSAEVAAPPCPVRLLLVDDDELVARAIARSLKAEGHIVTTALSADAALEMLGSTPIDFVLCDLVMPHVSGLELLARVRREHDLEGRFAILTGGVFTDAALADCDVPILSKPPDMGELRALLRAALERGAAKVDEPRRTPA